MPRWVIVAGILSGVAASTRGADTPGLAGQARGVLRQYCARCHHGPGSEGGEFDVLKHPDLLDKEFWDPSLVVAGKPEASHLFDRVTAKSSPMPPKAIAERPSEADKDTLKRWIAAGATAFPDESGNRPFVTLNAVLASALDYLRSDKVEAVDRPNVRFFTLHNLANDPNLADADLRLARAALSKALNSLSRKPTLVVPEAVDAAKTVYAVNVADLDWDRGHLWQAVERAYPYGLSYEGHPDQSLRRLDKDLCELSGADLPIVRADWFIATATRPPLYHTLLQLPADARILERALGVKVADDFLRPRPERISRAGFARSGVSGQNRMVERHDAREGQYYWKSYDFKADNARSKLTRFPLGPLNLFDPGHHPFPNQAFAHDGGEIIFGLPNGLQGYLLIDGKDGRIDVGPITVVSDALKTSGTAEVVNGVSCMACHKHGMIPFEDSIRANSAVFGPAEEAVRRLYVEKPAMDRLAKQDGDRFLAALERTVGPFLRDGADAAKPLRDFAEPVSEVARPYRLNYLDLAAVARELDTKDPQAIARVVGETKLKRLGLDGLLRGGVVGRAEWEAVDGVSLMQELAKELRYTPKPIR